MQNQAIKSLRITTPGAWNDPCATMTSPIVMVLRPGQGKIGAERGRTSGGQQPEQMRKHHCDLVVEFPTDMLLNRAGVNLPGPRLGRPALCGNDDPLPAAIFRTELALDQAFLFQ